MKKKKNVRKDGKTCGNCMYFQPYPEKAFDGGVLWGMCNHPDVKFMVMPKWAACERIPQSK